MTTEPPCQGVIRWAQSPLGYARCELPPGHFGERHSFRWWDADGQLHIMQWSDELGTVMPPVDRR